AGLTGYALAALMSRQGFRCDLFGGQAKTDADLASARRKAPFLLLNDVCTSLLQTIFPDVDWNRQGYALTHRQVLWGRKTQADIVVQPAFAIDGERLLGILENYCLSLDGVSIIASDARKPASGEEAYAWYVNPPSVDHIVETTDTGKRVLLSGYCRLMPVADPRHCYMESVADGWLFLVPVASDRAVVQAMLPQPPDDPAQALEALLRQSRLIAASVTELTALDVFPAAPSLCLPLVTENVLRLGERAVKLDPVSGEGTPFALRTALLAAAVAAGCRDGVNHALFAHYTHRLMTAFLSHLAGCIRFYTEAFGDNPIWRKELHTMIGTHHELEDHYRPLLQRTATHRLEGFNLVTL
ncbi:MAG: hypothetical protein ACU84J_14575, partial [Gammaproteobacteria bacterium]